MMHVRRYCLIPNIFYLYWQGTDFTIHHYICVKSIQEIEKPDHIFLYYNNPIPIGNIWWDRTLKLVTLREFRMEDFPEGNQILTKSIVLPDVQIKNKGTLEKFVQYAQHRSDLFRTLALYEFGGIYTDFDTVTVTSIRDQINDCSVFLASCRNATAYRYDQPIFGPLGKVRKDGRAFQFSHIANGNLGATPKHPYLKKVLENFGSNDLPGLFSYINAYELNKEQFSDVKIVPWYVFHSIQERDRNCQDIIYDGGPPMMIEYFFQTACAEVNPGVRVFHYYSSKGDCAHLLTKMPTAYALKYSNSVYSECASPFIQEFLPNWKKDGYIIAPDRIILEQKILPNLTGDVCFVGVASYVRHYWDKYFPQASSVTTVDSDHKVAKYGAKNHILADVKYLDCKTNTKFDYIVMHGIAGFGTSTVTHLGYAFRSAFLALKPGGLLIYGWNDSPTLRVGPPLRFLRESLEAQQFQLTSFLDMPECVKCNDYFDDTIEYNVPIEQLKVMDTQFMFFRKPLLGIGQK